MNEAIVSICIPFLILAIGLFIVAGMIWLFFDHGIDKIKHPEEWKDQGKSGEQIVYRMLIDKMHVPEGQIIRNVYIPTANGGTSEIDLLVVSKKGILVFECKNYAGNIYGDANRKQWIQYLGKKKSYFLNPFMQNRSHIKHLGKYLAQFGDIPMVPMVTTITRGKWKVKNYGPEDYLLGYNCHLKDILASMPDSELIACHYKAILSKLRPLSRPDESIRNEHIERIKNGRGSN